MAFGGMRRTLQRVASRWLLRGAEVGLTSGRQAVREYLAVDGLPAPPPGARNVVLIVWDTVRAYNLSLHGYPRNTSPQPKRGGRGREFGTTVRWRQRPGRTRRTALSSPASGLANSILCGMTSWTPQTRTLAGAPGQAWAIRPLVLGQHRLLYLRETGLDRGLHSFRGFPVDPAVVPGPQRSPESGASRTSSGGGDFYYDLKWIQNESRVMRADLTTCFATGCGDGGGLARSSPS